MVDSNDLVASSLRDMEELEQIHGRNRGKTLVLDHMLGWDLPFPIWHSPEIANLLARVRAWHRGLSVIAGRIARAEEDAIKATGGAAIACWVTIPGSSMERRLELQCDFDSFANMAACYARAVAAIAFHQKLIPLSALKSYPANVLGPANWYRDKVAAHLAAASQNVRDSEVERWMSGATRLAYQAGRISVGGESLVTATESHSSEVSEWALTQVFANMCARYWPVAVPSGQTISVSGLPPSMGVVAPAGNFGFLKFDMHQAGTPKTA